MKVVIAGQHPVIQPGFCGVMSLYEAKWLSEWGHEVTLVIPFETRAQHDYLLEINELGDINDLNKLGGDFEIVPVFVENPTDISPCDVLIWQLTNQDYWNAFLKRFAKHARILTKNFPKAAPIRAGAPALKNTFGAFDYLALSLKEDVAIIENYKCEHYQPYRYGFVGRGADPELFHLKSKSDVPFIAVDVPNTSDDWALAHFVEPLERLKLDYPDLKIVSLGRPVEIDGATHLPFIPYDQLAEEFINPAWLYCVIDYAQSSPHVRGAIHKYDPLWRDRAIYEVQNIEAQMAGAVLCGYSHNIIDELYDSELTATFAFPSSADAIYHKMRWAIENYPSVSAKVRARVERMHDWKSCIARWEAGLLNLLEMGYDRNQKNKGLPEKPRALTASANHVLAAEVSEIAAALDEEGRSAIAEYYDRSRVAVEFGIGGSTRIAAKTGIGHLYSVESDRSWIEAMKHDPHVQELQLGQRISFIHANVGAVKEWGYPVEMSSAASDAYIKGPWTKIPVNEVDFVLVDGRFRVATAVNASLRTDDHVIYAIDDYFDREHYKVLEDIFCVHQICGRMALLKKTDTWSLAAADAMLNEYRMIPL